ncbi:molybdopterin molybdochelatase [Wenxinia marina DSM 24838]|uniref:Molybdopterin molybdenumtransferase n=1 Tax=Wenxinia marina DSM 24838 TaxID=1123501 RepID=A0A0D0QD39_9RHOB|nr:molybdopterin molybdochelatase [Wenxinia marina DSM 24838]
MSLVPVAEALSRLFALVRPLGTEMVPLTEAAGRVLAGPVAARRDQPPFAASAMDGYAVRRDEARPGARFDVIGESAAGHAFSGLVGPGQAVRIFTGAPVPEGATRVVIQEDTVRDGDAIGLTDALGEGLNIRPAGADFRTGATLGGPRRLTPSDVALLAAMNVPEVEVARQPEVALLATGDELVPPGEEPGPDQIIASNSYGLHALLRQLGARPRLLPIAGDSLDSLSCSFDLAADADLLVTIGGASVGDHDLVAAAAEGRGMERAFYKVAMRPGKPLMAGRLGDAMMIGLPGNPVSAMVCGHVFVAPVIAAMQGLPAGPAPRRTATLGAPLAANGPREHYLRARTTPQGVIAFDKQDSSLLSVLAEADCLIVQPPGDPAHAAGDTVEVIDL